MAAKFFTGLPLDGPDPECVHGHGEAALAAVGLPGDAPAGPPRPAADHSHRRVPVTIGRRPPQRDCDENPLAGCEPPEDPGTSFVPRDLGSGDPFQQRESGRDDAEETRIPPAVMR